MDKLKVISILVNDGKIILESGERTSIAAWYSRAETNLRQAFGDNWKEFVTWDGYSKGDDYTTMLNRFKRSIGYVKAAGELIQNPAASTKTAPTEENSQDDMNQIKIFIVHGHDNIIKLELKNYLQNTLGLPEPIILHEKPNQGRTIIEKLEDYASEISLAFILLTPDDVFAQQEDSDNKLYRARQNVILELGYFLGLLGRKTGRVILLYKGVLDIPSDISGLIYINISNGIQSAGEEIRKEISRFMH